MGTMVEAVAQIVAAHASRRPMTADDIISELNQVHATLVSLENTHTLPPPEAPPALSIKQAFKKSEVICMVCGRGGMQTLTRHLRIHGLKPNQYREMFGIPRSQALTAKDFSAARRAMTISRGLADNLVKARAVKAANHSAKKMSKSTKPDKAARG